MTGINRRQFIRTSTFIASGILLTPFATACARRELTFGWVTDVHFAQAPSKWGRHFSESVNKMQEAIALFNRLQPDFVIETGDFKDQNEPPVSVKTLAYLEEIEGVFGQFKGPKYHVLGNHDLDSISKDEFFRVAKNTGIPSSQSYYSFKKNGFTCIVLDACFRSDEVPYNNGNFKWDDTHVPESQLNWLRIELKEAAGPVLVFTHQLLDGEGDLYVNNAKVVRELLEKSNNVMAVFQGHKHEGDYKQINNIHYITQKALVEGSGDAQNAYSVVTVNHDGDVIIDGYRRVEDRKLKGEVLMENARMVQ
jgi:alkaline phosphatase